MKFRVQARSSKAPFILEQVSDQVVRAFTNWFAADCVLLMSRDEGDSMGDLEDWFMAG